MKAFKRSRLMIPAALTAALVASPLAWSHGGPGDWERDRPPMHHDMKDRRAEMQHRFDHMAERLNLTEEQRDQMREIFKKGMEERKSRFEDMHDGERPQLMTGNPDSSEYKESLQAAADKAAAAARARVEARAEHYRAIYNVLNDEQREIWAKMQAEREEDRKEMRERGWGKGPKGPRHD